MSDTATPVKPKQFVVEVYDGNTWVLNARRQPVGYFVGERMEDGEKAAGALGLRNSQIRQGRMGRAQAQSDALSALEGWNWFGR